MSVEVLNPLVDSLMTEPISQMLWSFCHEIHTLYLFVTHLLSVISLHSTSWSLCNPIKRGHNHRVALDLRILNQIQWGFVATLEAPVSTT